MRKVLMGFFLLVFLSALAPCVVTQQSEADSALVQDGPYVFWVGGRAFDLSAAVQVHPGRKRACVRLRGDNKRFERFRVSYAQITVWFPGGIQIAVIPYAVKRIPVNKSNESITGQVHPVEQRYVLRIYIAVVIKVIKIQYA